ncbi:MAG: glycosyltransferase [Flavobacteriales bacterium]
MHQTSILHIVRMWPHAGDPQHGSFIQKHVKALADHQDIKQSVIVFADLDVHTTWHGVQVQSVKAAAGWQHWEKKSGLVLAWIAENGIPDAVHMHGAAGDTAYLSFRLHMAHGHRIKRIVTEHQSHWLSKGLTDVPSGAKWTIRLAHARMAVSRPLATAIARLAPCKVIPNVIDPSQCHREHAIKGRRFLHVGDWVKIKGIENLITAFQQHQKAHAEDQLTLIGDGPLAADLLKAIARNPSGISHGGRKTPDQVQEIMCQHDILVVNSERETFAMVIGEALERGLSVIATQCQGPETVYDPAHVTFREGSSDDIQDLVEHLAQAKPGQSPIAQTNFRSDVVAQAIFDIYQSLKLKIS